jgi:hypothetical protein
MVQHAEGHKLDRNAPTGYGNVNGRKPVTTTSRVSAFLDWHSYRVISIPRIEVTGLIVQCAAGREVVVKPPSDCVFIQGTQLGNRVIRVSTAFFVFLFP